VPRTIAIVSGTGAEGFGLALRFASAGARVIVGSRDARKAQDAARRIGNAEGRLNADAVSEADVVILTVPLTAQIPMLKSLKASFRPSATLVDTTVPLEVEIGGRMSHLVTLWAGSAAQQAARYTPPGVSVVGAFHTVTAEQLADLDQPIDTDVLICGNNAQAKAVVTELIAMLPGARAIDAGLLENARLIESAAALLVSLNIRHKVKHSGLRITGLEN
jgi:8-hydroxy-5-deazaflavin:NADPH oxidoreductase